MDRTMKSVANERQIGGSHYQSKGIQHWDIAVQEGWDYLTGNATKYLWRWKKKNGLEDLRKARHYIDKLIEVEETRAITAVATRCTSSSKESMENSTNTSLPKGSTDYSY